MLELVGAMILVEIGFALPEVLASICLTESTLAQVVSPEGQVIKPPEFFFQ
jgi:hypothetical protein